MKPLNSTSLKQLLKRFDNFKAAEFGSVDILSATSIKTMLNVQDSSRGYDWIGIELLFEEVEDAKLLEEKKLKFIDMEDGLSFFYENGSFFCLLGSYKNSSGTKNALCFIRSKSLKYQEIQTNI